MYNNIKDVKGYNFSPNTTTLKDVNHKDDKKMSEKKRQRKEEIKREIRKKTAGYIVAGLALVGGLAWNDAIKSFIELYFPKAGNTVIAKLVYALFVTIIIVVASYYVTKFLAEEEDKKK